jgi:hypothetical protein
MCLFSLLGLTSLSGYVSVQFAGADFSFWVCVCSVYYYDNSVHRFTYSSCDMKRWEYGSNGDTLVAICKDEKFTW